MCNHFIHNCRICGFYSKTPPWGIDGNTPTYGVCSCCNVEFGYEDIDLESVREYRKEWLDKGGPFFEKVKKPLNWKRQEQMKNINKNFL